METVVFGGVSYVKASDVAQEFKYTSDYVGQLCRDKKVDARLVGRAWYVNVDSVKAYRQSKHAKRKARKAEKKSKKSISGNGVTKIPINPRSHPTHRPQATANIQDTSSVRSLKVAYESDEYDLLPQLRGERTAATTKTSISNDSSPEITQVPTPEPTIEIKRMPTVTIKVTAKDAPTGAKLVADPLPEVSLAGKLDVTAAPEGPQLEYSSEEAETTDEKSLRKPSKIWKFLLFICAPLLWPLKLLRWLLRPFYRLGKRVFLYVYAVFAAVYSFSRKKIPKKSTPSISQSTKVPSKAVPTAGAFAPNTLQVVSVAERRHDTIRFWSILVSAILTSAILLSLGSVTTFEDGEFSQSVYVDKDTFVHLLTW